MVCVLGFSPHGDLGTWSNPVSLCAGLRSYGFQSALTGADTLLIATVTEAGSKASLNVDEFTMAGTMVKRALQVECEGLVDYGLACSSSQYAVVWVERQETSFYIYAQLQACTEKVLIRQTESFVDSLAVAMDDIGRMTIAWTDDSQGLQGVYLQVRSSRDAAAIILDTVLVSTVGVASSNPTLSVSGDVAHIVYLEKEHIFTKVTYRGVLMESGHSTSTLPLRRTTLQAPEMPAHVFRPQGGIDLLWGEDVQARGGARGSVIMQASIGTDGQWLVKPQELARYVGSITSVSVALSDSGDKLLVYANNQTGAFQVYFTIDSIVKTSKPSLVTYGTRHCFEPAVHQTKGDTYVVFHEIRQDGVEVFVVKHNPDGRLPLAVRLGLDPEAPLLDAVFKGIFVLVSAAVLSFLASGSIIVAALLSRGISNMAGAVTSRWVVVGSHVVTFAILAVLKHYGGYLYYGAVFVPGLSGALIGMGSAIFAICTISKMGIDRVDTFTLMISGYLWVLSDTFCSIYVSGVFNA